ncbi:Uncharacterized protein GBIM_20844 [Gryllus bimaculatus]|nr:Uncharacterized protein GBIM_20844 [Gryllus bimaculatus]
MAQNGRSILGMILKNFIKSLKPRQIQGDLIGTDYFGNKYYEIPANPSIGKRKPSRWFEPHEKDNFEQEMPAEWESWLRGRRDTPPLEEEIMKNVAIMNLKKANAAELERKNQHELHGLLEREKKGLESFPTYKEYSSEPSKPQQS